MSTGADARKNARPIRIVIGKPGLDGHDRGAKVIAHAFMEAGCEVIYTGLRQSPEAIVQTAVQEDADILGLSILSGAHNSLVPAVIDLLDEYDMNDVMILVGGIIPDADVDTLREKGVDAVFGPDSTTDHIVDWAISNVPDENN